jgi:hypothetical protein
MTGTAADIACIDEACAAAWHGSPLLTRDAVNNVVIAWRAGDESVRLPNGTQLTRAGMQDALTAAAGLARDYLSTI